MSRSICTVFVALAIFQGAFAINVVNIEPHSIINLELTNQTSPTTKLFDGERASGFIGDMTMGNLSQNAYTVNQEYILANNENYIVQADLVMYTQGKIVHYFSATNTAGSTVAFCGEESTLGSSEIRLNGRFPPHSISTIVFTAGVSSGAVKAIQALLIPFTLITLLLGNFHL